MAENTYFDRDLSWLFFNERVLEQAERADTPLLEKLNFLAIFSSNLDEFYRVRMPVLQALDKLGETKDISVLQLAKQQISRQQEKFGKLFTSHFIPSLKEKNIHLLFNEPWPGILTNQIHNYFFSQVMAFLQPVELSANDFFPKNNQLYFLITIEEKAGTEKAIILNIPSGQLPRFLRVDADDKAYILFLDDIIRYNLDKLFKEEAIKGCYSFKITRDADIELTDEYPGDLSR